MESKIIAVDFDGTLCENKYPEIGEPNITLIRYLVHRQAYGEKLILWTCRAGEMLEKAIAWCTEYSLTFDAVNENLPEIIEDFGSDTRKIFAHEYIDDRNHLPVLYLCDGKRCTKPCSLECQHTTNIANAKNFKKEAGDFYIEIYAEEEK